MIGRRLLLAAMVAGPPASAPMTVTVATARGELAVPVSFERGHAALPVAPLTRVLPMTATLKDDWAEVGFAGQSFRFLLGAPLFIYHGTIEPLAGGAYVARDSLFIPLQWITGYIPRIFSEGYRYDPVAARFEEAGRVPVVAESPRLRARMLPEPTVDGLRERHLVTIDAGHGGTDPGNPGVYFPRGVTEKDITFAIAKRVRTDLEKRGVTVKMTRTTDTLIALADRPKMCNGDCDLFVSIHVDALDPSPGYHNVDGLQTFFYGHASSAHARQVAIMENSAVRYEQGGGKPDDPLSFIFRDLANTEVLRESAVLANLIQLRTARDVPGADRGVSQANFQVLREALRPAVLVETGFATNRTDAHFLASSAGQAKLAKGIANGVIEYLRRYEAKTSVTRTGP